MCKLRFILTTLLLTVLVAASDYGEAATPVTIALTGPSTYSITAMDLPESSGMELSIRYDTDTLEAPQVRYGGLIASAYIKEANVSTAGFIRIYIVAVDAIKGTGELASITFTKKPGAQARLTAFTADVYSLAYARIPVTPIIDGNAAGSVSTTPSGSDPPATTGTPTGTPTGTTTGTTTENLAPVYTGSISFPDTQQQLEQKGESKKIENRSDSQSEYRQQYSIPPAVEAKEAAPAAVTDDNSKKTVSPVSKLHSVQSVPVRFRDYQGPRSLEVFTPFFDESERRTAGIVQTPAIIVSDGKSLVTVIVDLPHDADTPVFSLKGANQKSVRQISEKKWELDALPQKNKTDVRLSIILKGERIDIPLVVVPPLNPAKMDPAAISATGVDALLAKPLKNNKPAYDLNSDGKQDYLDDYILVAYWLLKQQPGVNKGGKKPVAAGK